MILCFSVSAVVLGTAKGTATRTRRQFAGLEDAAVTPQPARSALSRTFVWGETPPCDHRTAGFSGSEVATMAHHGILARLLFPRPGKPPTNGTESGPPPCRCGFRNARVGSTFAGRSARSSLGNRPHGEQSEERGRRGPAAPGAAGRAQGPAAVRRPPARSCCTETGRQTRSGIPPEHPEAPTGSAPRRASLTRGGADPRARFKDTGTSEAKRRAGSDGTAT